MQFPGLICRACTTYKLSDPDRLPYEQRLTGVMPIVAAGRVVPVVGF